MIHRPFARGLLSLLGLFLTAPCFADAITGSFTGNVATDFPSTEPGIITLVNPEYPTTNQLAYLTAHGLSPGLSIQDVRLYYNKSSDTMNVGVNFFGVAGQIQSPGKPVSTPSSFFGNGGSITLGFDMTLKGSPTLLAGVPQEPSQLGTGLNGFKIAAYNPTNAGLAASYGAALTAQTGNLRFTPSAQHPGVEFSISNFSKFPGYDPANGFGLVAYAGSSNDLLPEEGVLFPRVDAGRIPEPATVLGWSSVVLAGAAWRCAKKRRQQSS
jgi:hypothetical protein